MSKAFCEAQKDRNEFDGPATLGQSLELREDYYAFTYLYQFRRGYFFQQDYYGDDSNCDSELDDAREAADLEDEWEEEEKKKEEEQKRIDEGGEPEPAAEVPEEEKAAGEDGAEE